MPARNPQESASGRGKALLAIAAAVVVVLGAAYLLTRGLPSRDPLGSKEQIQLAVLVFGVEGKRDIDHIATGFTDGIIHQLSRVEALHVIPYSTVARYEGDDRDPVEVGRELGVSVVASGWVRARGEYLAVEARLQNVADGRVLWTHRYTRMWDNLLLIEQKTAQYIVEALEIPLTEEEIEEVTRRSTDNGVAYEMYLRGRMLTRPGTAEATREAIRQFGLAARVDSTYARAQTGLASSLLLAYERGYLGPDACARADTAVAAALASDDSMAPAQAARGDILWLCARDWVAADQAFQEALEIDPDDARVLLRYADFLAASDRVEDAIALDQRAIAAEPDLPRAHGSLADHLSQAGRYEEAGRHFERARQLVPDSVDLERAWITSQMARGSVDVARESFPTGAGDDPNRAELEAVLVEFRAGSADEAFDRATRMLEDGNPAVLRLFSHPLMTEFRQDERFLALARQAGWPLAASPQ